MFRQKRPHLHVRIFCGRAQALEMRFKGDLPSSMHVIHPV